MAALSRPCYFGNKAPSLIMSLRHPTFKTTPVKLKLKTSTKNQQKKMKMCAFRKTFIKDYAHRFLTFVKFSSEKLHSYP